MADYPALTNQAIGLFCADHFFSEGDTLEDMAAPVIVAATEAERYSEKLKVPGSRLLFFLRCLYAVGFYSGMTVYRIALAAALHIPQEELDKRFTVPDFHLDKKAARRAVNLLNNCSAEEIMNACPGFGFAEKGGTDDDE